jgi:cytokinin dehydrogenase
VTRDPRGWSPEDLRAAAGALGRFELSAPEAREAAERDFGRLVRRDALHVFAPRSIAEVERIVAFANQRGLKLTPRGRGMSLGGQSIPAAGVSLDLSRLNDVDPPDVAARSLRCSAGTTWRDAVAITAAAGLIPKVVPLNLDLTVGGLLSVAGVGATSHTYGTASACVRELEVVTGGGRRVVCSETRERAVYDASLAGLGRAALILRADIELRPCQPNTRTFYLLFDELPPWLAAQRALIAAGRADYLEGFCTPCIQGLRRGPRALRTPFARWFYALHVTVEWGARGPEAEEVLAGLSAFRLVHLEDGSTAEFAARYDPRFAAMRRSGAWTQPHPWVEAFVSGNELAELLPEILALYPLAFGDGPRLLFVERERTPPYLSMPAAPEVACCALLPTGIPPHLLDDTLEAFRAIHGLIVAAGGKRVLSGWTTMMDQPALDAHYGERALEWAAARSSLDPSGVLDSPLTAAVSHTSHDRVP